MLIKTCPIYAGSTSQLTVLKEFATIKLPDTKAHFYKSCGGNSLTGQSCFSAQLRPTQYKAVEFNVCISK